MTRSFKDLTSLLAEPGPRRNIQFALAAMVMFNLVFYLFAIGPLGESDRERRLQVETLRRQVRERQALVGKLAATVKKVEAARTEGDKLLADITVPRRTAFSTIVSELDQDGKKAGVELRDRSLSFDAIEGSDTLSMVTVTQGLEGSYENLVKFLNLLDRSDRFLIIESLGAAPQQSSKQSQDLLNVQIRLDAFMRES